MIINVNSYEEYKKASEKLTGTRWTSSKKAFGDPNTIVGVSWVITDPEIMKDPKVREIFGTNFCICDEFIKYNNKICSVADGYTVGILKGIEITEEDFYYVMKTDEGTKHCSCVVNIELA